MGEDQGEGEEGSKKNRGDKLSTNGCLEKSESLFRNSKKQDFTKFVVEEKGLIENLLTSIMQVP